MPEERRKLVIGVGELLWDCFPDWRRPGGAPANVAFHASQLGLAGAICSGVGTDAGGDELVRYVGERGLDTRWIQRDPHHPTGTVTVDTTRPEHPTYVIHENVAWDFLQFDEPSAELFAAAAVVCYGTLAQRCAASRETIRRALTAAEQALRVYDVNLRPPWYTAEIVAESLRLAHVVKLNADEVGELGRLLSLPADPPEGFAAALRERYGVRLVCVTRGGRGCLLLSETERVDVAGRPVEVVDAVGAGDAFTAALSYGLVQGWPVARAAHLANEVGALVAGQAGAMPVLGEALADALRRCAPGT
ncbi:MAG: carbohydrate kinase [Phycisphaerae bacterium]|jgi:fructokinase